MRPGNTTATLASERSKAEPPNITKTVVDEIGKASIRTHLAHLTGASALLSQMGR